MAETLYHVMENTRDAIRKSIYIFLKNYQYFTTTALLLTLPFSAAVLISQPLSAAAFSPPRLISTFSSIPFSLSFLLLSKASIIQVLNKDQNPSFLSLYKPLLLTHICNVLLFVTIVTVATFSLHSTLSVIIPKLGFTYHHNRSLIDSSLRVLLYYFVSNNVDVNVNSNLALVVAGTMKCGGSRAIYEASRLRKGKNLMIFLLGLPFNLGLISIDILFKTRVLKDYYRSETINMSMILEGIFIAYMYSIFIVLDTISTCILVRKIESRLSVTRANESYFVINIVEAEEIDDDDHSFASSRTGKLQ